MAKTRLDVALVERGLAETRAAAQRLIMAGLVFSGERRLDKAGHAVAPDVALEVRGQPHPYVSRGGLKLARALDQFAITVAGRVALDVGASTGGFTDCLLQAGAAKVHAVDVGYGQLAWKLAADPRVVVHDRQNIRKLALEQLGERASLAVADCSFISLTKVLPHLPPLLHAGAELVVLVKPQFEVGVERIGKGGIVRDDQARESALSEVEASARELGFEVRGHIESPIAGREGNREFLLWLRWGTTDA